MSDLAGARAALEAIAARERADPALEPRYGTAWWLGDAVADVAVVLLHGFTNCPLQYAQLGPQLAARGHAVIAPRIPYHGYRDRLTDAIAELHASDWESATLEAVALAARCGRRVVVLGISVGATAAAWTAARTGIDHAIAIAPFCGIKQLYGGANDALGALLRTLPNGFLWWDPRRKSAQEPQHGYPRFATRALGQSLLVSTRVAAAGTGAAHARRLTLVLNDAEPIVNNAFARRKLGALARTGIAVGETRLRVEGTHDVIEPQIPQAQTAVVYPRLIELIESV